MRYKALYRPQYVLGEKSPPSERADKFSNSNHIPIKIPKA